MGDNRKGTWEDVTGECELRWPMGTNRGKWLELHHGGSARALLGPGAIQPYGGSREYRIIENPGDTHYTCGTFRIEHFIPDPEPEWTDITAECHLTFAEHESGHYIRIGYSGGGYNGEAVGYVGEKVETNSPFKYRITTHPRKIDRGGLDSGCIKVEKRND